MLHIKSARHIEAFKIWISFDDGTAGEVNLENVLKGSLFEVLKEIEVFSKLSVDPELETVVWPNGADFAPEFLKELYINQLQLT